MMILLPANSISFLMNATTDHQSNEATKITDYHTRVKIISMNEENAIKK